MPKGTLVWHVLDDPDWDQHFEYPEDVLPFFEAAAAEWSSISTADIRLHLGGVVPEEHMSRDGYNTVSVEDDHAREGASYARIWSRLGEQGRSEIFECDVGLHPNAVSSAGLGPLVHELGHCLGLAHAAGNPALNYSTPSAVWDPKPVMSYGLGRGRIEDGLPEDDRIGVSLLRPAPGWRARTGSISGHVTLDGQPARFAPVQILRRENAGQVRRAVNAFTNEEGEFFVEGLAPAEYGVWIQPTDLAGDPHPRLVSAGAQVDVLDSVWLGSPHWVRAGAETSVGEIPVRRRPDSR
ncbi:MAG: hypothetical protein F4Z65_14265 [Acidobacteria bacterium]|nr:hypothetical protein [Acidobacteriota bacterium]MYA45018.1 hypothetical protein [Acidobacteriota bacterium]MYI38900.1 hypothetical protein [Acidobacteriota bacterium]